MSASKLVIAALVAAAVLIPLVCFTDLLAAVPGVNLSVLTKSYWTALRDNPKSSADLGAAVAFLGPILVFFLLFWYLWLQRNKEEVMLAVYARAMDVHAWLKGWVEASPDELPERLRSAAPKARRLFKKLDRLLSMAERANWRLSYSLYLVVFWFSNGPKVQAYRGVRVKPPPADWPAPSGLAHARPEEVEIAKNALEFSEDFVDGAKAWTGMEFLLHTTVGGVFGGIMATILGWAASVAVMAAIGPVSHRILAALGPAIIVGLVAGYVWERISNLKRRMANRSPAPSR